MEAEQADRGQLLGAGEVAEVVAVVAAAGRAGAALDQRVAVALPAGLAQVEAEAALGLGGEGDAVAGEAGRDGAVEDVEAEGDAAEQVVDLADPEQVLGRLARAAAARSSPAPPRISSLSRPRVPPIAIPSTPAAETASADSRRRSSWTPPWTIAEDRLARRPLALVPLEAAVEPAVGALGRAGRVLAVGVVGRALVEDEGDVGAERRLHLHRDLGRDEQLGAVAVGAEARRPPRSISTTEPCSPPGRPLPLTSSATPPWASEKTWKPPESVISARSQPMNPCSPPAAAIRSGPGETNRW